MPDLPDDIRSQILELERQVESEPDAELFARLADLYRTAGQLNQAEATCNRCLKAFPDDVGCLMTYARVLMDMGHYEDAEAVLEKVVSLGGEDVGVLLLQGQLYAQRNDMAGIHSVATKLAERHADDVRAQKFLEFLRSRGLLPSAVSTSSVGPAAEAPPKAEKAAPQKPPTQAPKPKVEPKRPPTRAPRLPAEKLMRVVAMIKAIAGVNDVVLLSPDDRLQASKNCPTNLAKALGGLLRTLKHAMPVAFSALEFGKWNRGVIELDNITVHLIEFEDYWLALSCDPSVSLGALRIAVSTIVNKHLRPKGIV